MCWCHDIWYTKDECSEARLCLTLCNGVDCSLPASYIHGISQARILEWVNRRPWFDSWVGKIRWRRDRLPTPVFLGFPGGSASKESTCNVGDLGSITELGRSPGEGKGCPLQYSGLENPMDCIVYGVAKSRTRLSDFHSLTQWGLNQIIHVKYFAQSLGAHSGSYFSGS